MFANNVGATNINEMYVKWKFREKDILMELYKGPLNGDKFKRTKISQGLFNDFASLRMDKKEAVIGNYTCEVTELSREGEIIELKYYIVSWFSPNESILVIFPVLAVLLSWGQFGIVTLKYKSSLKRIRPFFYLLD